MSEPQAVFSSAFLDDLIGCVSGGPPDLSEDTGGKYRDLLIRKRST